MKLKQLFLGILCLFAVVSVVFPLLGKKYIPTHDGEYHIIRFIEFSKMLSAGYLFPRWAPDLNSGYGVPIFQYHYPFPNYVGAVFRALTHDAVYSFQYSGAVAYILLVAGLVYWLRYFFPARFALVGAIIGAYTPYVFLDLFVRGAIGEIWAMVFLAFTLGAVERKKYILASVLFTLLVLSHNISAILFFALLGAYSLFRHRSVWYLCIAVFTSAFFWLPALFEQKYVVGLNTVNFRDHFVQLYEFLIPSWGTEFSATGSIGNKMSFQIGIVPLVVIIATLFCLRRETNIRIKKIGIFFLSLIGFLIFLFPFTVSIWNLFPPLQLIQYPWRLLTLVIPVTAFCSSYLLHAYKRLGISVFMLVLSLILTWNYVRPVQYEPRNEAYYTSRKNFTDGTSSMGNSFSTVWSSWKPDRPAEYLSATSGVVAIRKKDLYLDKEYVITLTRPSVVSVHTLYFPGWTAYLDGKKTEILYKDDGMISVRSKEGSHTLRIRFEETPLRKFADGLSIASLIGAAVWGILLSTKKDRSI